MKILFWVSDFPKLSETFIRDQIISLIDKGHKIYIFSEGGISNEKDALKGFEKYKLIDNAINYNILKPKFLPQKFLFFLNLVLDKNRKIYFNILKNIIKNKSLNFKSRYFYLAHFIISNDIKNIHTHFGTNAIKNIWIKKTQIPVKHIVTFHGFDIRLGLNHQPDYYKDVFEYTDKVIAISNYNHKSLVDLGAPENKIVFLSNAINTEFFKRTKPYRIHQPIRLLSVGRLVDEKAYGLLIKSIAELKNKKNIDNFILTIIGEGNKGLYLEKLIKQNDLEKFVKLVGRKPSIDVRNYMIESDAYILSSIAEAFPTVLLEAQSCGLPVVATDVGSVKDMVKEAIIVKPNDIKALVEGIEKLFSRKNQWQNMSETGRKNIEEKYSYKNIIHQLEKIYIQ